MSQRTVQWRPLSAVTMVQHLNPTITAPAGVNSDLKKRRSHLSIVPRRGSTMKCVGLLLLGLVTGHACLSPFFLSSQQSLLLLSVGDDSSCHICGSAECLPWQLLRLKQ